ncbi:MAG: helix-turn-helix domain-containing protein [Clostridia bacterium]|nr:helix-turn-helix domain-containing protein [Clostridia bacterium]
MIDQSLMAQMNDILSRLTIPVTILDKEDHIKLADLALPLYKMTDGKYQVINGQLYLPVRQPAVVLSCSNSLPGAKDVLILAEALIARLGSEAQVLSSFDVYRRTLRGELNGYDLETLTHEYRIPMELRRGVLVFHIMNTEKLRAYELLHDITPLQEQDVLIDIDRHTVALVKDMTDVESEDELVQYAQALQETLMGETAHQMTVGVGGPRHTLEAIRESYDEGRRAIEVGRIFQPENSVYVFNRLILERFLLELPQEARNHYHGLLFNPQNAKLFTDEMLYTIEMFFHKDLNLSDTARQLYIHRNTLVYRLDKVQRETGLDLRSFDDAVTFKILMELKKCCGKLTNQ